MRILTNSLLSVIALGSISATNTPTNIAHAAMFQDSNSVITNALTSERPKTIEPSGIKQEKLIAGWSFKRRKKSFNKGFRKRRHHKFYGRQRDPFFLHFKKHKSCKYWKYREYWKYKYCKQVNKDKYEKEKFIQKLRRAEKEKFERKENLW